MRNLLLFLLLLLPLVGNAQSNLVSAPKGLETEFYHVTGNICDPDLHTVMISDYYIEIAFDGDDVYMKGFFDRVPDGWLKGVRQGNLITFDNWQYLGQATLEDGSVSDAWMVAMNNCSKLTMKYYETSGKLTLNDYGYPMLVAGPERSRIEGCTDFTIKKVVLEDGCDFKLNKIPDDAEIREVDIAKWNTVPDTECVFCSGQIAITEKNIYIKGLLSCQKESWLKGELIKDGDDYIARFPVNQYLGFNRAIPYRNYHVWFIGGIVHRINAWSYEILPYGEDYVDFAWDPTAGTLSYNWISEREPPITDDFEVFLENATTASTISLMNMYISMNAKIIPTALSDIKSDANSIGAIYDVNGYRLESLHPGLNIIRTERGTKKVMIP